MKRTTILLLSVLFLSFALKAAEEPVPADAAAAPGGGAVDEIRSGLKSDMRLIFFAGVGGAVLGLSTLSFVDKPSKELRRISYGFGIGAILASIYVLYKTTSKSMVGGGLKLDTMPPPSVLPEQENYDDGYLPEDEEEDEEEYDEDFYGALDNLYLVVWNGKSCKVNFPIINVSLGSKDKLSFQTGIFKMRF